MNYPIDYSDRFRETLIAYVYTQQSDLINGGAIRRLKWDLRMRDSELGPSGPSDRTALTGTLGLSVGS
jgi:hypothetical protein